MVGNKKPLDQDEYRIGCFDGKVEDDKACFTHDSIEEEIVIDVEELHDAENLIHLLILKNQIMKGYHVQDDIDVFNNMVRDYEA